MKLLVVDDDASILEITARSLEAEGFRVEQCKHSDEVLPALRSGNPDLLILDVMLPGRDGFELCREIRKFSNLPIILLTARSDTIDVVVGLESGADDYVVKPFEMKELVARVRALLRRMRSQDEEAVIRVGPLEVRAEEGVVTKRDQMLSLTSTEFRLLCVLASKLNRIFTRENLLEQVWGYDYFGDSRLVDVHIRRLRSKIEDDPSDPKWILTMRGMGYKLTEG